MYVKRGNLEVAENLARFLEDEVLKPLGRDPAPVWQGFEKLLAELRPVNERLLKKRSDQQAQIDLWLGARKGLPWDQDAWLGLQTEIGYIGDDADPVPVRTSGVDAELATLAGPQLVVPVSNARFALNATNARWGSLYDALYGTDALGHAAPGGLDPEHARKVIAWVAEFLDATLPLEGVSHAEVTGYAMVGSAPVALSGDRKLRFAKGTQFVGHSTTGKALHLVFRHHGLHIELVVDAGHPVGKLNPSGLADVILESALTVIQDLEDSVAAVDAEDKVAAYGVWLGLMRGDLSVNLEKAGKTIERRLNADHPFTAPDGSTLTLPGRAVMLVRNVGHLMTTDAVRLDGRDIPEGMLDALVSTACALHDLTRTGGALNTRTGAIYVVKPKMQGPEEAALTATIFDRVEAILGLPQNTVKIGLMDEERPTSATLGACMSQLADRLVFINTGFLDRTGSEIHTYMQAGPVLPKAAMKNAAWLSAYEDRNVDFGLAAGLVGKGQIGKGMWAKPDAMAEMLATKGGHPRSGATTAWVPSPTAATLHAIHYHQTDVAARQAEIAGRPRRPLGELLSPPLLGAERPTADQIALELDQNCQSILGYVVRWVDDGIGCSKVPDFDNVGLMEDRATLRISAQLLANWLHHGLITKPGIEDSLRRMAVKVDAQNASNPAYRPMAPACDGPAFDAARDLILKGAAQPSGYTEPILHAARREAKRRAHNQRR
ncbi:MAG: malate synthase G [Cereibacter sphaeroides]|uniref:Malate synthase G n=1 Tax=Cereibacter sphaeroides TaxID=1063 RepID=A0A2W5S4L9_CERSP|nr:MAG: malate synthase G [Cereibacter sphaeroides]